jgi:hypothetical protein
MKANRKAYDPVIRTRLFPCECGGKLAVTLTQGRTGVDASISKCSHCGVQKKISDL